MKLKRLTDRVWYYPFEQERDRPNLSYIRGDNWSMAVDAGHSAAHTREFYRAIEEEGLPLPALTVLTHWHWDHTFGMHAVHGLTLANDVTNQHLMAFKDMIAREGNEAFFALHESIRLEYSGGENVVIKAADMVYTGDMTLDAGDCPIRLIRTEAPHTDDSTLVFAEKEKVLFVGDSTAGAFPTWEKDAALSAKLAETIARIDADICLESHWTPVSKDELIKDLLYGE